jgi:UDP-N-acetylmuramoyl-tripeptide--D-alanyl-D-alanine ligase
MKARLQQLQASMTGASLCGSTESGAAALGEVMVDGVTTDSRSAAPGNLFVALRGDHFDAHDFLQHVASQGAAAVVVERLPHGWTVPALVVPDTRIALGDIARYWRQQFTLPLIGVTGSNGKTTVKEMIASILIAAHGAERALATRGNLNNDIGVPLTLLRLNCTLQAAVVELGMNHPGEIAYLTGLAQPTVGLVNNAQREHLEFMQNVAAVAAENGAVLAGLPVDGVAVFPADDPYTPLWQQLAQQSGARRTITFGLTPDADVSCSYQATAFGSQMQVTVRSGTAECNFPLILAAAGLHNVRNALAAVACAVAIDIDPALIAQGLAAFAPVGGRLQRKSASNGAIVIDDTYNANPDSVRAAIDVLAQAAAPRLLVLGDMGEVGDQGPQFHQEIGAYAKARGIEQMLCLGELSRHAVAAFGTGASHFDAIETLRAALDTGVSAATTVLIKGSRFMQMERLVRHLIQPGAENTSASADGAAQNNLQKVH